MERLTAEVWFKNIKGERIGELRANGFEYFLFRNVTQQEVVNKLGKIEDILEKYKIRSLDNLDFLLSKMQELEKAKESVLKINKAEIKVLENGYSTLYCDRPEIITIIDQQIKELRGNKNEKL